MSGAATSPDLTIVPANEASWEDLQAIKARTFLDDLTAAA